MSKDDEIEKLFTETGDKNWTFITLDMGEEESFHRPENRLDCYSLNLYKNGGSLYKAYGKHTGEEFFTAELPLAEIVSIVKN